MKIYVLCFLMLNVLHIAALAQVTWPTYEFEIKAGSQVRNNVPICIRLPTVSLNAQPKSVVVTDSSGQRITAQLTHPGLHAPSDCWREVHFILPTLNAGATRSYKATLSDSAAAETSGAQFAWHDQSGMFTVLQFGNRPVLRYHYETYDQSSKESQERTYKVFHHLFSPSGDRIVTNGLSPEPNIHSPHHRGIFYGFNRIRYGENKPADTWHCFFDGSYQEHAGFIASESGPVIGRHRVRINWHGSDQTKFATEERELTAYQVPGGQLIEFASRLSTTGGRVIIDGDPQHAGFQFRAHNDVDIHTKHETIFVRPDGVGKPGETLNWDPATRRGPVNLPWNAMSFVLDGKRYTTAYLDHPENPKEARFSERDYGRFGSYFEFSITVDRPLKVNYRLWLQEGLIKQEEVAALSQNFVDPVTATVRSK